MYGSSPCVWGQVLVRYISVRVVGIIPMRVGTRCHFYPNHGQGKDHPHACGDKRHRYITTISKLGSSPCVWGQEFVNTHIGSEGGIIPMRVGTSSLRITDMCLTRDHPHACGDKLQARSLNLKLPGSSPCVWGQAKKQRHIDTGDGIIPMRVGTSKQSPITSNGG